MKKLSFLLLLSCVFFSATAQKNKKSNVLFIAVDDLKPELGCYGNKLIKTPNIDRLAKMGTVFLNNYCQQAVCGPTRASIMTGMRPDATKVWDLRTKMREVRNSIVTEGGPMSQLFSILLQTLRKSATMQKNITLSIKTIKNSLSKNKRV